MGLTLRPLGIDPSVPRSLFHAGWGLSAASNLSLRRTEVVNALHIFRKDIQMIITRLVQAIKP